MRLGLLLTAYSAYGFVDFRLPEINNTNYEIPLSSERFALPRNMILCLEVMDGEWRLLHGDGYRIFADRTPKEYFSLSHDAAFSIRITETGSEIPIVISTVSSALKPYTKRRLGAHTTIGKGSDNHIQYDFRGLVSQRHAVIERTETGHILRDLSTNGIFVNTARVSQARTLKHGDCIHIMGLRMIYLGDILAIDEAAVIDDTALPPAEIGAVKLPRRASGPTMFKRSPRVLEPLMEEPVEIESPPQLNNQKEPPLLMTIGPSFTMMLPMLLGSGMAIYAGSSGGAYMYTGIITACASAFVGVFWALMNIRYRKKSRADEERMRFSAYRDYLIHIVERLKTDYAYNQRVLHARYPSARDVCGYYDTVQLWNRNAAQEDFLCVRVGVGSMPFQVPITIPKERFSLTYDTLSDKPKIIRENYSRLNDVPICVDLLANPLLGIYGANALEVAHCMALQIAACNSYTDVKLLFLYNKSDEERFGFAKWLPHVWSEDKKTRYVACTKEEPSIVLFALSNLIRMRGETQTKTPHPHIVVLISNLSLLEGEPIAKHLLNETALGVSTIVIADRFETLPNQCSHVLRTVSFSAVDNAYALPAGHEITSYDSLSAADAEAFAREISGIEINEPQQSGDLINMLSFLDMYGVASPAQLGAAERWKKNRTYENMRALIGQKAGGENLYLDIHEKYHGPHGLMAGTTGSGKSETLQTYIISLAVNFSPEDVGFFLIDYKGGGMANLFAELPHVVGSISNLSGNAVRRAMISIQSEIRRRQRLFNQFGVNHIDMYTRLRVANEVREPLPHLLIIIDEFAQLKNEEPDFMRELISVAQVGRSLGIHLILATQKPSGTVDDNIWSNARFKLCLRVQDRQDSMDMLHKPDASLITQTGRGYLQVGNDEIYELFQSGWSGAAFDEEMAAITDTAIMITSSGRQALVSTRAKLQQKEKRRLEWLLLLGDYLRGAMETQKEQNLPKTDESVIRALFALLARDHIDFPQNVFNEQRIADMLSLCEMPDPADETKRMQWARHLTDAAAKARKQLPEYKEKTQLAAIVEYLTQTAADTGIASRLSLWMPELPAVLYSDDPILTAPDNKTYWNAPHTADLVAVVGLCDDPINQQQIPLEINLSQNGHAALLGMVATGKSTFLQTFLYALVTRHSPDDVHLYILDYSNRMLAPFEDCPHCGGVLFDEDEDKTSKFFVMLEKEIGRRKQLFKGGSYQQYIRANSEPAIIVVIDGYAHFKERTGNRYEDHLIALTRDGVNSGVYFVCTAGGFGSADIQSRIGDQIKTVLCLDMGDKFKFVDALHTMNLDVLPESGVKGRGLTLDHDRALEFQTAVCIRADDDYQRAEIMREHFKAMCERWKGRVARPIPFIPEKPTFDQLSALPDYRDAAPEWALPIGYQNADASVYTIDLRRIFGYIIAGRARCGKSNALRCVARVIRDKDPSAEIVVIDTLKAADKHLETLSSQYLHTDEDIAAFANRLLELMRERNAVKKEMRAAGDSEEQIFTRMLAFPALYILFANYAEFVQRLYTSEGLSTISGFIENFLDKGENHHIFLFAAMPLEEFSQVAGRSAFDVLAARHTGMLLGGAASGQRLFDMSALPYAEQTKVHKAGIALIPDEDIPPYSITLPLA